MVSTIHDKVPSYFTDQKYGKFPLSRTIPELLNLGIINLDKPANPTSHEVTAWIKQILKINKAGHGGTLDPAVTGCLPVALGRATRALQVLLPAGKEYICIMKTHHSVSPEKLENVLVNFRGKIYQTPPVRSNVKRRLRVRKIYELEVKEHDGSHLSLLRIKCEAGTYIRKLCVHPDTKILTNKGSMSILALKSNPTNVFSKNNSHLMERRPSKFQKIKSPEKLLKITMDSGIDFIVTPDHELLTSTDKGYRMIEAKELKKHNYLVKSSIFPKNSVELVISDLLDDEFLIEQEEIKLKCKEEFIKKFGSIRAMNRELGIDRRPFLSESTIAISIKHLKLAGIYDEQKNQITSFKTHKGLKITFKKLNQDIMYLLGLIASDGNNTKEKNTVRFTRLKFFNKEKYLVDKFLEIYKEYFPNFSISLHEDENDVWMVDTSNSFLATIAASLGIKSPKKKYDISLISNLNPNLLKSFLRGYFDGDGTVSYTQTKNNVKTRISLYTINKDEAFILHKILLKIDIPNKINIKDISDEKGINRNKIARDAKYYYEINIGQISAEKRFIIEVGTNHPKKKAIFNKILNLEHNFELYDHYHIGYHYKEYIREYKSELRNSIGGNLNRVLNNNSIPMTRRLYNRISTQINIPELDEFIIERIKKIEIVKGVDYVYDMTIPETHNFLIETGFVSSNCFDIGLLLGSGAHMQELRRSRSGPFSEDNSVTLQDVRDAWYYYSKKGDESLLREIIQPIENICVNIPKIYIRDTAVDAICHGAALTLPGVLRVSSGIESNS
ncbi:MAG: LAGLIDADG family homing endonuclease, partial [Candidatus Hodarchaeales archaeon]